MRRSSYAPRRAGDSEYLVRSPARAEAQSESGERSRAWSRASCTSPPYSTLSEDKLLLFAFVLSLTTSLVLLSGAG